MKKALIFALSLSLALALTACGGSNDNTADSTPNTSTPEVTQPVDTSTPEVEQTTAQTTQETTPETTPETEQPQEETPEETPVPEEVGPKFTEVNETVYATTSVNVRSSYSADSDKVGSLSTGASVTRTGVGDNGWSRIVYGDSVAYVSSDYLTTTKPSTGSTSSGGNTSTSKPSTGSTSSGSQTSKPSTGGNTSSGGSTSGGNTSSGGSTSGGGNTSSGGNTSGGTVAPEEIPDWATGGSTSSNGDTDYELQEKIEAAGGEFNPETGGVWVP